MGMLYPKITNVFYFTGSKVTAPNCPIEMLPHYNPSNGAQFFRSSDAACSSPAYFGLPFFLKDFGPIFQEWSVTGHESRPGHHTQVQGRRCACHSVLKPFMGISREIEVATIFIAETTILVNKRDDRIAISIKFDNFRVVRWRQRNLPKSVRHVQSFNF